MPFLSRNGENEPWPSKKQRPERKWNYNCEEIVYHNVPGRQRWVKDDSHKNHKPFYSDIIVLGTHVLTPSCQMTTIAFLYRDIGIITQMAQALAWNQTIAHPKPHWPTSFPGSKLVPQFLYSAFTTSSCTTGSTHRLAVCQPQAKEPVTQGQSRET